MGAMRTAAGRRIGRLRRRRTPFLALVETPEEREVRGHTPKVARFGGWIGSDRDGPYEVRAFVGDDGPIDAVADRPRPDVLKQFPRPGMRHAYGFSLFLDLPDLVEPLPVRLELGDGARVASTSTYALMPDPFLLKLDTYVGDPPALADLAARHLRGRGLEFGALHAPVQVGPACTMEYADKLTRDESYELFYDMREQYGAQMVEVDHIVDLDLDDLLSLEAHAHDFYIAAGVIEHLVNPLRFLENVHRIMKPGGLFLLSAPDRDYTWDCDRELTTNEHLLDEYERGERVLSDEHLEEFIRAASPIPLPDEEPHRTNLLEFHRARTIHVHVWDTTTFPELLRFANERLALTFEIVESAGPHPGMGNVLYVLRKGREATP